MQSLGVDSSPRKGRRKHDFTEIYQLLTHHHLVALRNNSSLKKQNKKINNNDHKSSDSPVSRTVYRGFDVSIGSMPFIQDIMGGGEPTAEQESSVLWPFSTTFITGDCVIIGKPVGSLSAVTDSANERLYIVIMRATILVLAVVSRVTIE